MAQTFGFWDADRQYLASEWVQWGSGMVSSGVALGIGGQLAVTGTGGLGLSVASGYAYVRGNWIYNDSAQALTATSAHSTLPRIDRVVVRRTVSTKQVQIVVKAGTPDVSPTAPTLQQDSNIWETSLARYTVAAGATAISALADERAYAAATVGTHTHSGPTDGGLWLVGNSNLASDAPRYNLLINGGFEVWQRGVGPFTASGAYTADNWQLAVGAPSTVSVTQITSTIGNTGTSVQLAYTHGATGAVELHHALEEATVRGRTVTFTATVKASVAGTVKLQILVDGSRSQTAYNTGTAAERLSVTAAIPAGALSVSVLLRMDVASATIEANDATLVVGSVAADYLPVHPVEELARCQRYYERHGAVGNAYPGLLGTASGAAQVWGTPIGYAVHKQGLPTISKVGTWTVVNCAQPTVDRASATHLRIFTTATAAGGFEFYPSGSGDYIEIVWNP